MQESFLKQQVIPGFTVEVLRDRGLQLWRYQQGKGQTVWPPQCHSAQQPLPLPPKLRNRVCVVSSCSFYPSLSLIHGHLVIQKSSLSGCLPVIFWDTFVLLANEKQLPLTTVHREDIHQCCKFW